MKSPYTLLARFRLLPSSLALARVCLGCTLLVLLGDYFSIRKLYFVEGAFLSAESVREIAAFPRLVPDFLVPESESQVVVLLSIATLAVLVLMSGRFLGAASLVVFVVLASFRDRFPFIYGPGDAALKLVLIWVFYAHFFQQPFAIDPAVRRRWQLLFSLSYLILVVALYEASVIEKLRFPEWTTEMDALSYLAVVKKTYTPWGSWVLERTPRWALVILTAVVMVVESLGVLLLFVPRPALRRRLALFFLGFHFVIVVFVNVRLIAYVFMVLWFVFLQIPPRLARRTAWLRPRARPLQDWRLKLGVTGFLVLNVLIWHGLVVRFLPELKVPVLSHAASRLGLEQRWSMFANPELLAQNNFVSIDALLTDGSRIDPFTGKAPQLAFSPVELHDEHTGYTSNFMKRFWTNSSDSTFRILERAVCHDYRSSTGARALSAKVSFVSIPPRGERVVKPYHLVKCAP